MFSSKRQLICLKIANWYQTVISLELRPIYSQDYDFQKIDRNVIFIQTEGSRPATVLKTTYQHSKKIWKNTKTYTMMFLHCVMILIVPRRQKKKKEKKKNISLLLAQKKVSNNSIFVIQCAYKTLRNAVLH